LIDHALNASSLSAAALLTNELLRAAIQIARCGSCRAGAADCSDNDTRILTVHGQGIAVDLAGQGRRCLRQQLWLRQRRRLNDLSKPYPIRPKRSRATQHNEQDGQLEDTSHGSAPFVQSYTTPFAFLTRS
jgi:hypothetical protein